jgi:hypothetical protein
LEADGTSFGFAIGWRGRMRKTSASRTFFETWTCCCALRLIKRTTIKCATSTNVSTKGSRARLSFVLIGISRPFHPRTRDSAERLGFTRQGAPREWRGMRRFRKAPDFDDLLMDNGARRV